MHPTNGSPSSTSLRPRTRRLISIDDELGTTSGSENGASPFGSRATSPGPTSRPLRANVTSNPSSAARSAGAQASKAGRNTSATFSSLWGKPWSAIQGLTANVLGSEAAPQSAVSRRRKPLSATHRHTTGSAPPKEWGPAGSSSAQVGAGPQEEREALVRAMKRKDLLNADERLLPDSVGRIKRRNSDDRMSFSAPPGENEDRDALVYIHPVRPQDTLAGITIKFNCQPAVLRKANRMWPNDSIQIKKTIILPVDACGVKGRPVDGPNTYREEDLLLDYGGSSNESGAVNNSLPNGWAFSETQPAENSLVPSSSQSTTDTENFWTHNSWVLLPNDTTPTEIGRMPRRALGFFPPARRKSLAFSDATPTASLDLPRSSISTNPATSQTVSPGPSTSKGRPISRTASFSGPNGRHRSNSKLSLHGPGGVGTMGKNVRSPGPGQDGLNKLFASHLPNVAPPPNQEYFTPWAPSLLDADSGMYPPHGGSDNRPTAGGAGIDLQDIGGAIEGWVRKMGSQATKLLSEPGTPGQGKRSAVPVIGAVGGDLGDLIELRDDAFEIGDGEEERGRTGREETMIPISDEYQSARADFNLVLRDRGKKGSGSKTD